MLRRSPSNQPFAAAAKPSDRRTHSLRDRTDFRCGYAQGLDPDDPEFAFYTDPAQYLADQAGDGFDQIVFVPFSDGDGPADPDEGGAPDFDPDGDLPLKIEAEAEVRYEKDDQDGMAEWMSYLSGARHHCPMLMMYPRGTAFIPGLWEFVPYNDPASRPKNEAKFAERVNDLRDALLNSSDSDRKNALRDLKDHYVRTFPKSQLNDLSLFFMGVPLAIGGLFAHGSTGNLTALCSTQVTVTSAHAINGSH